MIEVIIFVYVYVHTVHSHINEQINKYIESGISYYLKISLGQLVAVLVDALLYFCSQKPLLICILSNLC